MRLLPAALLFPLLAHAGSAPAPDDGATSIAAGGLVARRETRITMAKEVLRISLNRVVVDYDFRNDTAAPVTTEIAFPIPPYQQDGECADPKLAGFDDFQLTVNAKPVAFQTESKARSKDHDLTEVLNAAHVDIASFGHQDPQCNSPDIGRLAPSQRQALLHGGALQANGTSVPPA